MALWMEHGTPRQSAKMSKGARLDCGFTTILHPPSSSDINSPLRTVAHSPGKDWGLVSFGNDFG